MASKLHTPEKIDSLLRLEKGCCRKACENEWVVAIKDNGDYLVAIEDARSRWDQPSRDSDDKA